MDKPDLLEKKRNEYKKPDVDAPASAFKRGKQSHQMEKRRLTRLKEILSIPTQYKKEELIIAYIVEFCEKHRLDYIVDDLGSILITKGKPNEGSYYGCIGGHIDSIHPIEPKTIIESKGILTAWSEQGQQIGCGADDLCSVHIALEILMMVQVIKVAFFVSEEIFCVGVKNVVKNNRNWFNDVGYFLEFDAPELMITRDSNGVDLFDEDGEFIKKIMPHLKDSLGTKLRLYSHPFTDVSVIRSEIRISCINLFAGYYQWHTSKEYVAIGHVSMAIELGLKIINELGYNKY